jgi:hypothetical protein
MPSYRVTLEIGALGPGVNPARILPAAKAAAQTLTVVEAADVSVVAGRARIVVRFASEDGEVAAQIGRHVASIVQELAVVERLSITERVKSAWVGLRHF